MRFCSLLNLNFYTFKNLTDFKRNIIINISFLNGAKYMKIKGFTLSEVLITLVIIGVIAAMTVPTITARSREAEYLGKLKKFYSLLNQVMTKSKALGYDWEIWCEDTGKEYDTSTKTTSEFAKTYLLPFVNYMKTDVVGGKYTIYLMDGAIFSLSKEQCLHFFYDVNGEKKPNVAGRDKYRFTYCPSSIDKNIVKIQPGLLVAYSWQTGTTRNQALAACKSNGETCSKLLLMDNWTYKKDYPYHI